MKFCTKCGKELEENTVGCPGCDGVINDAETPEEAVSVGESVPKANIFKNKKILIGAISVIVVIVAAILIVALAGGGYKKAVDKFFNVAYKLELTEKNVRPLVPEMVWEEVANEEDFISVEDMFEEFEEEWEIASKLYRERLENYKIDYKITDEEELSTIDLKELGDDLEDYYDMNFPKFTEGYQFELKVYGKSKDAEIDDIEDSYELMVVKMDGEWYVLDGDWAVFEIIFDFL